MRYVEDMIECAKRDSRYSMIGCMSQYVGITMPTVVLLPRKKCNFALTWLNHVTRCLCTKNNLDVQTGYIGEYVEQWDEQRGRLPTIQHGTISGSIHGNRKSSMSSSVVMSSHLKKTTKNTTEKIVSNLARNLCIWFLLYNLDNTIINHPPNQYP